MADVMIEFGAKIDQLISGVEQVNTRLDSVAEHSGDLAQGFGRLRELILTVFSVEAIKNFIESMASLGLQTERTMAMLGGTAEFVSTLSGVAKLSGTSIESLSLGLERMALNVQRSTKDAFSPQAEALRVLGLRAKDLIGVPVEQYFQKLLDAANKFNPSMNLTSAMIVLGGRGAAQLAATLSMAGESWQHWQEELTKTGTVLDNFTAKGMAQTHEKLTLLGLSVEGLGIKIFSTLKPAIDEITVTFTRWIQSISADDIKGAANTVGEVMINIASAVAMFFVNVKESWDKLISSIGGGMPYLRAVAVTLYLMGGQFAEAKEQLSKGLFDDKLPESFAEIEKRANASRESIKNFTKDLRDAFEQKFPAPTGGGGALGSMIGQLGTVNALKKDATAMDEKGKDALMAQITAIEGEIKGLESGLKRRMMIYDADAKQFKITEQEKFAAEQKAVADEYQAELAKYDKLIALRGIDLKQKEEFEQKKKQAGERYLTEETKLNEQAIAAQEKAWSGMLGSVEGAFNSQLRGLLAGTESWAAATNKILGDLIIKMIEGLESFVVKWIAGQIAMTTASQNAAAAQAAASATASGASGLGTLLTTIMKTIAGYAGQTSAAVTADVAPVAGPAAPAIGTAAGAATMASAMAFLGQAAEGIWQVPSGGGLVQVHAGETVAPANFSQGLRDAMSGGGGEGGGGDTYHVHAIDSAGVASFISQHAPAFATAMRNYQNRNPSARPSY